MINCFIGRTVAVGMPKPNDPGFDFVVDFIQHELYEAISSFTDLVTTDENSRERLVKKQSIAGVSNEDRNNLGTSNQSAFNKNSNNLNIIGAFYWSVTDLNHINITEMHMYYIYEKAAYEI